MLTQLQREELMTRLGTFFEFEEQTNNLLLKQGLDMPPFKMVFIPGGEFMLGDGSDKNNPTVKVSLSSFYMAEFPVTQELYAAMTQKNPSYFEGDMHPVEKINWFEAVEFCHLLNAFFKLSKFDPDNIQQALCFRLPTEAEWEYAAQGKDKKQAFIYSGSNEVDSVAWYKDNNYMETRTVGLKFPNSYGIYDMSGNVWEWCWDWYSAEFYKTIKAPNPINLQKADFRVLRGGSWHADADGSRLALRNFYPPDFRDRGDGFRLVLGLQFTN